MPAYPLEEGISYRTNIFFDEQGCQRLHVSAKMARKLRQSPPIVDHRFNPVTETLYERSTQAT